MFENVVAGWKMGSAIRKLVFQDKRLFVFPLIAGIVILIETLAVFLPLLLFNAYSMPLFIIGLFVYYIIVYFTSTYVLVAMLLAWRSYTSKKPIGFMEALGQASAYAVQIFEWAVFEAIVTMVIRAIERRLGPLAGVIFGLGASIAMSVVTAFAIPVIIDKKTGPISTIKESTSFIIRNFGATFGGLIYGELYSLIFTLLGILLLFVGIFSVAVSVALAISLVVIGVLLMVFGGMLAYLLTNIYRFVLYEYKNGAKLPDGITSGMVDATIRKKGKGPLSGLGGGFAGQQ